MRMTEYQFNNVKSAVSKLDTAKNRRAAKERGMSSMSYRWALFFEAGGTRLLTLPGMEDSSDVAARRGNLKDRHVETALRRIIPNLQGI